MLNFGYKQNSGALNPGIFPLPGRQILDSREAYESFIDDYTTYELERMFVPLVADISNVALAASNLTTPDAVDSMTDELFPESSLEDSQRHLLAFTVEVQKDLKATIDAYKNGTNPQNIRPIRFRYEYDGKVLKRKEDTIPSLTVELQERAANPDRIWKYDTGEIGAYFQNYISRAYTRATALVKLLDEYTGTKWANLSLVDYRAAAKVLTDEIDGFTLESHISSNSNSYRLQVRLSGQDRYLDSNDEDVPVAFEQTTTLMEAHCNAYTGSGTADAVTVKNFGSKALICTVGTGGSSTEYLIHPIVPGNDPSKRKFSKADAQKHIKFTVLERLVGAAQSAMNVSVNAARTRDLAAQFTGKHKTSAYGYSNSNGQVASIGISGDTLTVTGISAGTTNVTITASNPSGDTSIVIPVTVT